MTASRPVSPVPEVGAQDPASGAAVRQTRPTTAPRPAWVPAGAGNPFRYLWNRLAAPPVPFLISKRSDARVESLIRSLGPGAVILNVGAGGKMLGEYVINLDIYPTGSTHALASVFSLPFADGAADLVILQGVLEHVLDPGRAVAEVVRVLRPGAVFYTEMPFLEPYHEAPIDVSRRTQNGLIHLCLPLTEVDSGIHVGPASTLTWVLREFLAALVSCGNPMVYRRANSLIGWVLFPLRNLDHWFERHGHFHRIAGAFYYIGRKDL
jgi:SAM-dependent methyltransferase